MHKSKQKPLNILLSVISLFLIMLTQACTSLESNINQQKVDNSIPNTEIYLADISFPNNKFTIGEAINITQNSGYDNQPFFLPGNDVILFTSVRNTDKENQQTDIYSYSLTTQTIDRVTNTPESEYSPTLTPSGKTISVVRVDEDGEQRLWEFPILSSVVTNKEVQQIFPGITRVGYHVWKNQNDAFLFLVDENSQGEEHSLVSVTRGELEASKITTNIGRSLTIQPNTGALVFVDKTFNDDWSLKRLDSERDLAEIILPTLNDSEDMVWMDEDYLLMARGSSIYMHSIEDKYTDWLEVANSAKTGITGSITRLAVSPNRKWLAIVVTE